MILHADIVIFRGSSAYLWSAIEQLACEQKHLPSSETPDPDIHV